MTRPRARDLTPVTVVLGRHGRATVDGRVVPVPPGEDAHLQVLDELVARAAAEGAPLVVTAHEDSRVWGLLVHPDGQVEALPEAQVSQRSCEGTPTVAGPQPSWVTPAALEAPNLAPAGRVLATSGVQAWAQVGGRGDDQLGAHADIGGRSDFALESDRLRPVAGLVTPPVGASATRTAPLGIGSSRAVRSRPGRRSAAVAALAALVLVAISAVLNRHGAAQPRTAPSPVISTPAVLAAPSSAPAETTEIPVGAPPGFSGTPMWSTPVPAWTRTDVASDNLVITRSVAGNVTALDLRRGRRVWTSADTYGSEWQGPYVTRIDGTAVVALATTGSIRYWPAQLDKNAAPDPVTVSIPPAAHLIWAGGSPLVVDDRVAAVVRAGSLMPVTVPAGSTVVATDGTAVIAVQRGASRWYTIGPTGTVAYRLPPPSTAAGAPHRVDAVGGHYLLATWTGSMAGAIDLVDTTTGRLVLQGQLPDDVDLTQAKTVCQVGGSMTAVGPIVVDTRNQRIDLLTSSYTPVSISAGHVYATSTDGAPRALPVDIRITGSGRFQVVRFTTAAPVPVAVTASPAIALVMLPSSPADQLVALPPA